MEDEFGEICRDQIMNGLKIHVKDFKCYALNAFITVVKTHLWKYVLNVYLSH